MTAQDIAESILKSGQLVGGRQRYRNVSSIVSGERKEVAEPVNFHRPAWPGEHRSGDYRAASKKLMEYACSGEIPFHVPTTEILKTVECRISEMLYFVGFYPEKIWGKQPSPLSVSKKIHLASHMFPEDVFPAPLIRDIQDARNVVEHQFAEPDRNNSAKMLATMFLFLDRTDKLISILQDVSMVQYRLEDLGCDWRIQFCRDEGIIVIFRGEYSSSTAYRIRTIDHIVKNPDYCIMLIQRVLTDIDKWEGDPWFPFHLDEIIPDTLGPDTSEGEEDL